MALFQINVSSDACEVLATFARQIEEESAQIQCVISGLETAFAENQIGLGTHSDDIAAVIENLKVLGKQEKTLAEKLIRRITRAENNRRDLLQQNPYQISETDDRHAYIPEVLGRMYDTLCRMRIRPDTMGPDGQIKGRWEGDVFFLNEAFVPKRFNPEAKTFFELCRNYTQRFGIEFCGVSFADGYADFGYLAIAKISTAEVLAENIGKPLDITNTDATTGQLFDDRNRNMRCADAVASRKQIPISGLAHGYTKDDLALWRKENGFTWDENYKDGYCLIPSFIHGNIMHTGMVAIETNSETMEKKLIQKGK